MLQKRLDAPAQPVLSVVIGLLLLAAVPATEAEVYKWIAADGSVQYGDSPPKSAKVQKVDGSLSVISPTASVQDKGDVQAASGTTATSTVILNDRGTSQPSYADILAEARRKAVERCERNRGTNCEEEADAQSYPTYTPTYVTPYWSRPVPTPTVWPAQNSTDQKKNTSTQTKRRWSKQTDEQQ